MLKVEEIARAAAMVVVEMGETDDIVVVPAGCSQVRPQFSGKVDPLVVGVVVVTHIGIVDQHLLAIGEIDAGTVGISERVESQFCSHLYLLF